MAVKIRMKRQGRRNRPFYRIVIIDSRKRRDGKPIEELGWYNPIQQIEKNYEIDNKRIIYWINEGAQPSNTVKNILKKEGILLRIHLQKQGLSEKDIEYEFQKWEMDREERLKNKKSKIKKSKKQNLKENEIKTEIKTDALEKEKVSEEKPAEESVKEEKVSEEKPAEESVKEEKVSVEKPENESEKKEKVTKKSKSKSTNKSK
ncbi:MAG: 30S ribosomal protein S16 [Candidatus Marinimicrobia bacterium]|nr:30S ribosomal protein S16 [Candidatus Neomarinimicrobiota bacterium]